jgi:hypothetical protein
MLKANASTVMQRLCEFWRREMPDRILASIATPSPRWEALVRDRGWDTERVHARPPTSDDPDTMLDAAEAQIVDRAEVLDDTLPSFNPNFGYGDYLFGGLLGAPLRFFGTDVHTWSEMAPLLPDWSDLDALRFDPEGMYARKCVANLRSAVQQAAGRYAIGPALGIDGLNLAVMLRGTTAAYLDTYDHPEELRRLMAFGLEFNLDFLAMERATYRAHNENAFGNPEYAALCLENSGMSMSVDAYNLCDARIYREMGFEFHRAFIERAGRASFHIHGDGWHLVDDVARLPGLNCVLIEDDAQGLKPRVFDRRADWRDRCGDLPIALTCTVAELAEGLDTRSLPGGMHYMTWSASVAEANALMERVWSYRAPRERWAVRGS